MELRWNEHKSMWHYKHWTNFFVLSVLKSMFDFQYLSINLVFVLFDLFVIRFFFSSIPICSCWFAYFHPIYFHFMYLFVSLTPIPVLYWFNTILELRFVVLFLPSVALAFAILWFTLFLSLSIISVSISFFFIHPTMWF